LCSEFSGKQQLERKKVKKLTKGKSENKATAFANSERTYLEREDG